MRKEDRNERIDEKRKGGLEERLKHQKTKYHEKREERAETREKGGRRLTVPTVI